MKIGCVMEFGWNYYFLKEKKNRERKENVGERDNLRVESVILCMFVESISGPEVITS